MEDRLIDRIERERRLREFGLSEYASRAYLSLLELGPAEARPISRAARVPIAKIYSTLDQLAERGLCTIEPGPPKRFSPVPFGEYLERVANEHEELARVTRDSKEKLEALFTVARGAWEDDRGSFHVTRGRRVALDRLRQLVGNASESVILLASDNMLARRAFVRSLLEETRQRGVRVRLLARTDMDTVEAIGELERDAEIRAKEAGTPNIAVAIIDESSALIIHFVPDDASTLSGNDVGLFTDEEAIVGALHSFLEEQWSRSEPFADTRARMGTGQSRRVARSLRSEADAVAALQRAVEPGASDHRAIVHDVQSLLSTRLPPVARSKCVVRIATAEDALRADELQRARPSMEIRHADLPPGIEYEIFDGGIALLAFRAPSEPAVSFTLTNDVQTTRGLLAHFQDVWERSMPLAERTTEVARVRLRS